MGKGEKFTIYDLRLGEWDTYNVENVENADRGARGEQREFFLNTKDTKSTKERGKTKEGKSTRSAQVPREKRVDFKKIFGTIIPNFGKVRTKFRVENGERRVEDG